jgi:hypothetical protein
MTAYIPVIGFWRLPVFLRTSRTVVPGIVQFVIFRIPLNGLKYTFPVRV